MNGDGKKTVTDAMVGGNGFPRLKRQGAESSVGAQYEENFKVEGGGKLKKVPDGSSQAPERKPLPPMQGLPRPKEKTPTGQSSIPTLPPADPSRRVVVTTITEIEGVHEEKVAERNSLPPLSQNPRERGVANDPSRSDSLSLPQVKGLSNPDKPVRVKSESTEDTAQTSDKDGGKSVSFGAAEYVTYGGGESREEGRSGVVKTLSDKGSRLDPINRLAPINKPPFLPQQAVINSSGRNGLNPLDNPGAVLMADSKTATPPRRPPFQPLGMTDDAKGKTAVDMSRFSSGKGKGNKVVRTSSGQSSISPATTTKERPKSTLNETLLDAFIAGLEKGDYNHSQLITLYEDEKVRPNLKQKISKLGLGDDLDLLYRYSKNKEKRELVLKLALLPEGFAADPEQVRDAIIDSLQRDNGSESEEATKKALKVLKAAKNGSFFEQDGNRYIIIDPGSSNHSTYFIAKCDSNGNPSEVIYCDPNNPFDPEYGRVRFKVVGCKTVDDLKQKIKKSFDGFTYPELSDRKAFTDIIKGKIRDFCDVENIAPFGHKTAKQETENCTLEAHHLVVGAFLDKSSYKEYEARLVEINSDELVSFGEIAEDEDKSRFFAKELASVSGLLNAIRNKKAQDTAEREKSQQVLRTAVERAMSMNSAALATAATKQDSEPRASSTMDVAPELPVVGANLQPKAAEQTSDKQTLDGKTKVSQTQTETETKTVETQTSKVETSTFEGIQTDLIGEVVLANSFDKERERLNREKTEAERLAQEAKERSEQLLQKIASQEVTLAEVEQQVAKLQEKLNAALTANGEQESDEIAKLRAGVLEAQTTNGEFQAQNLHLASQLELAQKDATASKEALTAIQARVTEIKEAARRAKEEREGADKARPATADFSIQTEAKMEAAKQKAVIEVQTEASAIQATTETQTEDQTRSENLQLQQQNQVLSAANQALQAEIETLKGDAEHNKEEIDRLTKELAGIRQSKEFSAQEVESQQKELQSQIDARLADNALLHFLVASLRATIGRHEATIQELSQTNQSLRTAQASLEEGMKRLLSARASEKTELQQARDALKATKGELQEAQTASQQQQEDLAAQKQRAQAMFRQAEEMSAQAARTINSLEQEVQAERAALDGVVAGHVAEIASLRAQLAQLQKPKETASIAIGGDVILEDAAEVTAEATPTVKRGLLSRFFGRKRNTQAATTETVNSNKAALPSITIDNDELVSDLESKLQKALKELKTAQKKLAAKEAEADSLMNLDSESQRRFEKVGENEGEELDDFETMDADLRSRVVEALELQDQAEKEVEKLTAELKQVKDSEAESQKAQADLQQKLKSLQAELNALRQQGTAISKVARDTSTEARLAPEEPYVSSGNFKRKKKDAKSELEGLKRDNLALVHQLEAVDKTKAALTNAVKAAEQKAADLVLSSQKLREELDASRAEVARQQLAAQEARRIAAEKGSQADDAEKRAKSAEKKLSELEAANNAEKDKNDKKLQELQAQLSQITAQNEELLKRLPVAEAADLHNEGQESKKAGVDAGTDAIAMDDNMQEMQAQIAQLQAELASAKEQINELSTKDDKIDEDLPAMEAVEADSANVKDRAANFITITYLRHQVRELKAKLAAAPKAADDAEVEEAKVAEDAEDDEITQLKAELARMKQAVEEERAEKMQEMEAKMRELNALLITLSEKVKERDESLQRIEGSVAETAARLKAATPIAKQGTKIEAAPVTLESAAQTTLAPDVVNIIPETREPKAGKSRLGRFFGNLFGGRKKVNKDIGGDTIPLLEELARTLENDKGKRRGRESDLAATEMIAAVDKVVKREDAQSPVAASAEMKTMFSRKLGQEEEFTPLNPPLAKAVLPVDNGGKARRTGRAEIDEQKMNDSMVAREMQSASPTSENKVDVKGEFEKEVVNGSPLTRRQVLPPITPPHEEEMMIAGEDPEQPMMSSRFLRRRELYSTSPEPFEAAAAELEEDKEMSPPNDKTPYNYGKQDELDGKFKNPGKASKYQQEAAKTIQSAWREYSAKNKSADLANKRTKDASTNTDLPRKLVTFGGAESFLDDEATFDQALKSASKALFANAIKEAEDGWRYRGNEKKQFPPDQIAAAEAKGFRRDDDDKKLQSATLNSLTRAIAKIRVYSQKGRVSSETGAPAELTSLDFSELWQAKGAGLKNSSILTLPEKTAFVAFFLMMKYPNATAQEIENIKAEIGGFKSEEANTKMHQYFAEAINMMVENEPHAVLSWSNEKMADLKGKSVPDLSKVVVDDTAILEPVANQDAKKARPTTARKTMSTMPLEQAIVAAMKVGNDWGNLEGGVEQEVDQRAVFVPGVAAPAPSVNVRPGTPIRPRSAGANKNGVPSVMHTGGFVAGRLDGRNFGGDGIAAGGN